MHIPVQLENSGRVATSSSDSCKTSCANAARALSPQSRHQKDHGVPDPTDDKCQLCSRWKSPHAVGVPIFQSFHHPCAVAHGPDGMDNQQLLHMAAAISDPSASQSVHEAYRLRVLGRPGDRQQTSQTSPFKDAQKASMNGPQWVVPVWRVRILLFFCGCGRVPNKESIHMNYTCCSFHCQGASLFTKVRGLS